MAKTKMVEGWLCRDDDAASLVIFWELGVPALRPDRWWFMRATHTTPKVWGWDEFHETYGIDWPAPGERVLVDIEL